MLILLAAVNWNVLVPIIVALAGPIFAYLAAARRLSGKITTTDASKLWDEAGNLRKEYKTELNELRVIVSKLRDSVKDLEAQNDILHLENGELRLEVTKLRAENHKLKTRIEELEAINGRT